MNPHASTTPDILVVDDDPVSRDLLVLMLQSTDARVTAATDGQHAVEIIQSRRGPAFEVVFTDVQMPRMDGFALLEWLNANAPTTATVVMTGNQERELVSASLRGGAVEFLDKPFDLRAILRATRQARETHRRRVERQAALERLLDISDINQRLTRTALVSAERSSANFNLTTRFYAINEAGGDLVKATLIDPDRILLVLGDVSGHGLKEGFLSAYFQGIIEGMAHQAASCRSIAEAFNHFLNEQWNDKDSMTIGTSLSACFLEIDFGKRRVSALNCGSPGVLLADRRGGLEILAPGGAPLGWFSNIEPVCSTSVLDASGLIVLWSDGLEAQADVMGVSPIALAYRILQSPPHSLANTLLKNADDDIVACRLEWSPPKTAVPASAVLIPIQNEQYRGDSSDQIDALQESWTKTLKLTLPRLEEDLLHDVILCVREAVLNALNHGCEGDPGKLVRFELLVDGSEAFLHTRVTDDGAGFNPECAKPPDDPEHISLGLQVIRALTHAVRHSSDGRTIELTFCLPAKSAS
jgi:CheY-like chemotaxis protein/anti-sigma regulatory factor (Ser/Thr protein kinase)